MIAIWAVATIGLVRAAWAFVPPAKVCPDFICFWSAAELMSQGQSPYNAEAETQVQRVHGWDKATDGIGIYEFLPYFYPPWFGMLFLPLLPLGYQAAKLVWLVLNIELLFGAGLLLRKNVARLSGSIPIIVACAFALSVYSLLMGQTPPLIFFLIALTWRLLDKEYDWCAGSVLAWLTIKPQITAILLLALFLWALRRRRWGVVLGFGTTLGVLALVSSVIVPSWALQMLRATSLTPLPTDYFPWYGTTWLLVLRSLGLHSWPLWGLYLAAALPFLAVVVTKALDRQGSLEDLLSLALLAVFFIAPYGQPYDFTVLLIPFLVLLGGRLSEKASAGLLMAILILPYLHISYANRIVLWWLPAKPAHQVTLFWIPLLLTSVWAASVYRSRSSRAPLPQASAP
jgi:hypothetical protein